MIKLLNLSSSAINRLKYLKQFKDKYLYINITGGGCSGFQYNFNLINHNGSHLTNSDPSHSDDDKVVIYDDNVVKVFSNPESSQLMKGCTLDFQQEMIGSKFILEDIQNSIRKCSCGNSFELKDF